MSHQDPVLPAGYEGQSDKTIGVVLGVVGTLVVVLVGALSVVESWRLNDHCFHSHPQVGLTPLGEGHTDASTTLFPIGYSCVWETAAGPTVVTFTNWPLTIAAVAGLAMIALAGWRLSRLKR